MRASVWDESIQRGQWLLGLMVVQSLSGFILQSYEALIKVSPPPPSAPSLAASGVRRTPVTSRRCGRAALQLWCRQLRG